VPELLADLQGWMLDAIVAGSAEPEAVRARIAEGGRLGPEGRFAIYANGYRSRLLETLRDEFPALRLLVGETVFELFARSYIAAHPPRHFSLYDYGARFAGHLEATRPAGGGPLAGLPAALARLERARAEVQRAEGTERHNGSWFPAEALLLPGLMLKLPDSVRLLRPDFDLLPLIEASEKGGEAVVPAPGETRIAVVRGGYRVRQMRLEPWRHAWLEALGSDGADAYGAAAAAAERSGREAGALIADLVLWLPAAAAAGLVTPA
jgi:hypothetical protein